MRSGRGQRYTTSGGRGRAVETGGRVNSSSSSSEGYYLESQKNKAPLRGVNSRGRAAETTNTREREKLRDSSDEKQEPNYSGGRGRGGRGSTAPAGTSQRGGANPSQSAYDKYRKPREGGRGGGAGANPAQTGDSFEDEERQRQEMIEKRKREKEEEMQRMMEAQSLNDRRGQTRGSSSRGGQRQDPYAYDNRNNRDTRGQNNSGGGRASGSRGQQRGNTGRGRRQDPMHYADHAEDSGDEDFHLEDNMDYMNQGNKKNHYGDVNNYFDDSQIEAPQEGGQTAQSSYPSIQYPSGTDSSMEAASTQIRGSANSRGTQEKKTQNQPRDPFLIDSQNDGQNSNTRGSRGRGSNSRGSRGQASSGRQTQEISFGRNPEQSLEFNASSLDVDQFNAHSSFPGRREASSMEETLELDLNRDLNYAQKSSEDFIPISQIPKNMKRAKFVDDDYEDESAILKSLKAQREDQMKLLEQNVRMHDSMAIEEKKNKSKGSRGKEQANKSSFDEELSKFSSKKNFNEAGDIDYRSRISGVIISNAQRLKQDSQPRAPSKRPPGGIAIARPRTLGLSANFEYKNQIYLGRDKYIRKKSSIRRTGEILDPDDCKLNSKNIVKFRTKDEEEKAAMELEAIQKMVETNELYNMYTSYYKNFPNNMFNILSYVMGVKQNMEAKEEEASFQDNFDPFTGENNQRSYSQSHNNSQSMEDFQERQTREQILMMKIFDHMEETEFNSLAYFFEQVGEVDMSFLKLQEMPRENEVKEIYHNKLIEGMKNTIKNLEIERDQKVGENPEDRDANRNNNFYERKIENLNEIIENYEILAETEYKYAYQKFNNWRQFCDQLPIYSKKVEFLDAFENNQVIILQSTAGSGKSTQLPQYILEACEGRTVITEPRAIAVESVANRVHAELTSCLAPEGIIGYICGPNFNIKAISKVVYMTEHEFLNQFLRDQQAFLDCFDNFVIDEAHELRKPQLVILAVLRNLLRENPKKKLIVTSATLEAELFKNYFSEFETEIITAETPTYGVEVIDNQFPDLETSIADNTIAHLKVILDHITKTYNMKLYNKPNVLVFLPSIPEIKRVLEKVQEDKDFGDIKKKIDFQFEEFHGALTPMEKNKVIDPPESAKGSVRIILATNIAETAVTIDNIMYVLDSGREREYYQDELTSLSTQKEEKISKSSSIQRQGRAGRICSGYCYRMYTQEDFESFEDQKKPEILRMDISDLILLSIQLNDFFMMSDLLFFDKIEAKIMPIDRMLGTMKCYDFEDESKVLTPKGLFMIESSLQTSSAAFLYESLKLDNADYGYIATAILEKPTGYFRSNDSIRLLVEKEMRINNPLLTKLGDLAPFIYLVKEYDNLSKNTDMKKMYNIQESDFRRIKGDITRLKYEVSRLKKYYIDEVSKEAALASKYPPEERLEIAFLRTFPKNICITADSYKRYPYYLMVHNKELMKVHGSSITPRLTEKPEWICCQNIVVSSITQREMTKIVVPIEKKMIEELKMEELNRLIRVANKIKTRVEEFEHVPTALINFYRRRNRIELFQKLFKENKIYLETEEEIEKVLYFYIYDPKDKTPQEEELRKLKVREVNQQVVDFASSMIQKRHALIKISDRTKFQVNENSQIIDVLTNTEYLGILVKSASQATKKTIQEVFGILNLKESEYNVEYNTQSDVSFVFLLDKHTAREYYTELNAKLSAKNPPIQCYELKGGSEDFGAKFKKWKFMINWYEGTPHPDVTLKIFSRQHLKNLKNLLDSINDKSTEVENGKKKVLFKYCEEDNYRANLNDLAEYYHNKKQMEDNEDDELPDDRDFWEIKLTDVIGENKQFEDLIGLEDFLEKKLNMKESLDYRLYCQRLDRREENQQQKDLNHLAEYFSMNKTEFDEEITKLEQEEAELDAETESGPSTMNESMDESGQVLQSEFKKKNKQKKNYYAEEKKKKKEQKASKKAKGGKKGKGKNDKKEKDQPKEEPKKKTRAQIVAELAKLKQMRLDTIEKYESELKQIKEVVFMRELNMCKDLFCKLDVLDRQKLETIFPILQNFNVLCFKPDSSVTRRALIYQTKNNESEYVNAMKTFLKDHHKRHCPQLESRLKVIFKGKYILKINKQIFSNFANTITYEILKNKYNLQFSKVETNLKVEIQLHGKIDNPRLVVDAYEELTDLLRAVEFNYDKSEDGRDPFNFYAIFSSEGDDIIQKINNRYSGELLIECLPKTRKVLIRGTPEKRDFAMKELNSLEKRKIEESASIKNLYLRYESDNTKSYKLYSSEFKAYKSRNKTEEIGKVTQTVEQFIDIANKLMELKPEELVRRHHSSDHPECGICKREAFSRYRLLKCSHLFCKDCIRASIEQKNNCKDFKCPELRCREPIALYDILCMFSQVELENIFAVLKTDFLVENKDRYRYCPTANCDNILERTDGSTMMFCTSCGYDSCFLCGKSHYDSQCQGSKKTKTRKRDDVKEFTCPDPDCQTLIREVDPQGFAQCHVCKIIYCLRCAQPEPFVRTQLALEHIGKVHGFK